MDFLAALQRAEEKEYQQAMERLWRCVGERMTLHHNLLVLVSASPEERVKAADAIATQIAALSWTASVAVSLAK